MSWLRGKKAVVVIALVATVSVFAAIGIAQAMTASISGHTVSYSDNNTSPGGCGINVTITGPGGYSDMDNIPNHSPCGTYSGSFTLPANAQSGTYVLNAVCQGDCGYTSSTTVNFVAPSSGGGGGAPAATPVPGNPSFTG